MHYLLAGVAAFLVSFVFNFYVSRVFIFKKSAPEKAGPKEFSAVIAISVIGLALTEALLYLGTGRLGFDYRASKIIASVIVLFWNYFARKQFVYRAR
jgi:putative flippase GtrA